MMSRRSTTGATSVRGEEHEIEERPDYDMKSGEVGIFRADTYDLANGLTDAGRYFENSSFGLIILITLTFFVERVNCVRKNRALWSTLESFKFLTVYVPHDVGRACCMGRFARQRNRACVRRCV